MVLSIRFILTCLEVITAVVLYVMFLVKKDGAYALLSLSQCFLIGVSLLAVLVNGSSWMWMY